MAVQITLFSLEVLAVSDSKEEDAAVPPVKCFMSSAGRSANSRLVWSDTILIAPCS